jgi:hypothetical protein
MERNSADQENRVAGDIWDKGQNGQDIIAQLDQAGLPLVPQPTSHGDDPLNWSRMLKLLVTLQISWLAMLGPMSSAVVNPAFVTMGKTFNKTPVEISYGELFFLTY